tara:strand:- start:4635 stop:5150 length:516 start_codon:yes stop_codon:yes gene_type:complete
MRKSKEPKIIKTVKHKGQTWKLWRNIAEDVDSFCLEVPANADVIATMKRLKQSQTVINARRLDPETMKLRSVIMVSDGETIVRAAGDDFARKSGLIAAQETKKKRQEVQPSRAKVERLLETDDVVYDRDGRKLYFTGKTWKIRGQQYKIYVDANNKQYRRRVSQCAKQSIS